ncbi:MAG: hypothetical protein ACQETD_08670 [Pseudomonadota bacterium]
MRIVRLSNRTVYNHRTAKRLASSLGKKLQRNPLYGLTAHTKLSHHCVEQVRLVMKRRRPAQLLHFPGNKR